MIIVVDTDVLVAGIRSSQGASAALLLAVIEGNVSLALSVPLALEYEAVATLPEHLLAARAEEYDIKNMLDVIIGLAKPVEVHYQWRPQLHDAGDEMVLEAAVNGGADIITTFNLKDYGDIPTRFGIQVMKPVDVLRRIRQ